jgi:adenine phosphoribosyltransferase
MSAESHTQVAEIIERLVRVIPDYPKPGISFKDITPLLADAEGFAAVVHALADAGRDGDEVVVDVVVGLEARGFIFGTAVALELGVGFIPVRKPGKLPAATYWVDYDLEYGQARIEIHQDAVHSGTRVLIVDDVLATGGTARAAVELVERCGATATGLAVMGELPQLGGRAVLGNLPVTALTSL